MSCLTLTMSCLTLTIRLRVLDPNPNPNQHSYTVITSILACYNHFCYRNLPLIDRIKRSIVMGNTAD